MAKPQELMTEHQVDHETQQEMDALVYMIERAQYYNILAEVLYTFTHTKMEDKSVKDKVMFVLREWDL